MRKKPVVTLVGAGPGDAGLLTRAAEDAIRSADVVFYDALVSPDILRRIAPRRRIFVGKRGGNPSPSQEEINRRVSAAARRGRHVVRLKGGDPFLFGRGAEEAEALRKKGIEVRCVPGISSGMAAATYAGFPLTDRRHASSVTFLTATAAGGTAPRRDYKHLVRLGGTWVFFMGLKALPDIVRKLKRAGADPRLPAAVVSRATTPFQRVVTAPLAGIADAATRHRVESPALTIVGHVVTLRPPPLTNVPALVMRPEHQAGKLSGWLRRKGAVVTEIPILNIVPIRPNPRLTAALRRLNTYDWIVLTSANSVRLMRSALRDPNRSARLAAIGPGTAAALRDIQLRADLIPENQFQSEGLAAALLILLRRTTAFGLRGATEDACPRILLPQAEAGRDTLAVALRRAGHRVDVVPIYRTEIAPNRLGQIRSWIRSVERGVVPLTSASMAKAFAAATRGISIDHLRLVSIGPITTEAAANGGLRIAAEAPQATLAGLVDTLETVS